MKFNLNLKNSEIVKSGSKSTLKKEGSILIRFIERVEET